jgi:2-oxoglutarate/2-oxoacid ferredoxin oxidoreductase subunit beta
MPTAKEFANQNEVRWCPGCGDHAILKHFQSALAKSGIKPHETVVVSGIGCASRLPYYMNTYGFHTIHGRSFPIATGLKLARPELNVWVITGDGDALSIGGNHYIHLFRRDIDLSILLFNNQIYGLTKGQYSPTSAQGQYSKSTPSGSEEMPLNAIQLALTAGATFACRTFDRDAAHIQGMMVDAQEHKRSALVEILQNCPIFNDGIFDPVIDKKNQAEKTVRLVHGQPLLFGEHQEFGIVLEDFSPKIVPSNTIEHDKLWIHDETSSIKAAILAQFGYGYYSEFPLALGIIYRNPKIILKQTNQNYENVVFEALNSGIIK